MPLNFKTTYHLSLITNILCLSIFISSLKATALTMGRLMDIFCSSPLSTAICSGSDQRFMVRRCHSSTLDRHVQHQHKDSQKKPPIIPKASTVSSRKSTSSSSTSSAAKHGLDSRRKSSADVYDLTRMINYRPRDSDPSRCLLSNNNSTDHLIEYWPSDKSDSKVPPALLVRNQSAKEPRHLMHHDSPKLMRSSSSSRPPRPDQVVVLRVSLHCKGCEAKVRKHISKMEGVTSFRTDLETKKVTVTGNVTASGVGASLSRVKHAQLWPSSLSTSP